jgi:flagellin
MTISATGASQALAALQTLQSQTAGQTAAGQGAGAAASVSAPSLAQAPALTLSAGVQQTDDPLRKLALGLSQGASLTDAAGAVGQSVGELLQQLQQTAQTASDAGLSSAGRASLNSRFLDQLGQISDLLGQASVNGQNLINGSLSAAPSFAIDPSGESQVSLPLANLSLGGPIVSLTAGASVGTASAAASSAALAGQSASAVDAAVQQFYALGDQLNAHAETVTYVAGGTAGLTVDSSGESARLAALQVQQALTAQPVTISNPASQAVLSLFKG